MSASTWTRRCGARWSCSTARRCSPARLAKDPMLPALALAASLASFTLQTGVDTTFSVPRGIDLNVANYAGEVFVEGWDRNALKIEADHSSEDRVIVFPENGALVVKAYSRQEDDHTADLRLIVPAWMNISVQGIHTDVI